MRGKELDCVERIWFNVLEIMTDNRHEFSRWIGRGKQWVRLLWWLIMMMDIYRQENLYIYMSFRASLLITIKSWYLGRKIFSQLIILMVVLFVSGLEKGHMHLTSGVCNMKHRKLQIRISSHLSNTSSWPQKYVLSKVRWSCAAHTRGFGKLNSIVWCTA